jgi:hypothetical protein
MQSKDPRTISQSFEVSSVGDLPPLIGKGGGEFHSTAPTA